MIDPLIKSTPWVTKIGHEMTFLLDDKFTALTKRKISNGDYCPVYNRKQFQALSKYRFLLKDNNVMYDKCYTDDHVIEVTSEPIKSWTTFINWNKKIRKLAENADLTPEVDWVGGGMGHHHIDFQEPEILDNLFRIVAARPYLAWIFVHPSDKKNAVSLASWFLEYKTDIPWYMSGDLYFSASSYNCIYPEGRGNVISVRNIYLHPTIEWRGFDAAIDMEMQVEHTAFLQALVKYAQDTATLAKKAKLFKSKKAALKVLTDYATNFDKCVNDFYEFIEVLGLPKERYERYVETNLKARINWKTTI